MPYHHTGDSFLSKAFKRIELYFVQAFRCETNGRKCFMRIFSRIAVSWKVFSTAQYPYRLHPTSKSNPFLGYILLVLTKRTVPYDGVVWIRVNIYIRSKVELHSQLFAVQSNAFSCAFYQLVVFYSPQGHIPRKSKSRIQTHRQSPFSIHCHKKRYFRKRLIFICQPSLTLRPTFREDNTSYVVFLNHLFHFFYTLGTNVARKSRDHKKLAYFLLKSHLLVGLIHPFLLCFCISSKQRRLRKTGAKR